MYRTDLARRAEWLRPWWWFVRIQRGRLQRWLEGWNSSSFLLGLSLDSWQLQRLPINQAGFHGMSWFWTEETSKIHLDGFCGILDEERIFGLSSVEDSVAKKILDGEKMGIESFKKGWIIHEWSLFSYASLTFQETMLFLTLLISREFKRAYFLRQEPFCWNISI